MELATANKAIESALAKAKELGRSFTIAVMDDSGRIVALQRMDGAHFVTPDLAMGKAFASAALGRPGVQIAEIGKASPAFITSIVGATDGKFVAAPGGTPIVVSGKRLGAIGASGGTPEQDPQVADAGAAAVSS
jgi:uncharacterized protein GlcG (DUF336 family)